MFNMTFREKSIAVQIAAILVVYAYFGTRYWGQLLTGKGAFAVLMGITFYMIAIMVVAHIIIAVRRRPEKPDERDRVVKLRGSRNAYGVLATGVWCVLLLLIMTNAPHSLLFVAMMGAFALSELVRLGSQLVYYRFGA
jgi:hypothetical protein